MNIFCYFISQFVKFNIKIILILTLSMKNNRYSTIIPEINQISPYQSAKNSLKNSFIMKNQNQSVKVLNMSNYSVEQSIASKLKLKEGCLKYIGSNEIKIDINDSWRLDPRLSRNTDRHTFNENTLKKITDCRYLRSASIKRDLDDSKDKLLKQLLFNIDGLSQYQHEQNQQQRQSSLFTQQLSIIKTPQVQFNHRNKLQSANDNQFLIQLSDFIESKGQQQQQEQQVDGSNLLDGYSQSQIKNCFKPIGRQLQMNNQIQIKNILGVKNNNLLNKQPTQVYIKRYSFPVEGNKPTCIKSLFLIKKISANKILLIKKQCEKKSSSIHQPILIKKLKQHFKKYAGKSYYCKQYCPIEFYKILKMNSLQDEIRRYCFKNRIPFNIKSIKQFILSFKQTIKVNKPIQPWIWFEKYFIHKQEEKFLEVTLQLNNFQNKNFSFKSSQYQEQEFWQFVENLNIRSGKRQRISKWLQTLIQ